MQPSPIKVLIIDDSALVRDMLKHVITSDSRFQVVGTANDPYEARDCIKRLRPDVITLDVEMPRMNGITFLENLMRLNPLPVLMVSTLTAKGAAVTLDALTLGAVDFVQKPKDIQHALGEFSRELVEKLAAAANTSKLSLLAIQTRLTLEAQPSIQPSQPAQHHSEVKKLVAIGGSTGGLEAVKHLLTQSHFNGSETFVICLHLPGEFTRSYAQRLDQLLPLSVKEAEHNEMLQPGHIYIAPGTKHLTLKKRQACWRCWLNDDERVSGHKPSVDVLFSSIAKYEASDVLGVILTGMGKDGANGLHQLKLAGARTIAQDEQTSIVWGMPGEAVKRGCVDKVLPLDNIASHTTGFFKQAKPVVAS